MDFIENQYTSTQHVLAEIELLERCKSQYDTLNLEALSLVITNIVAVTEKKPPTSTDLSNIYNKLFINSIVFGIFSLTSSFGAFASLNKM